MMFGAAKNRGKALQMIFQFLIDVTLLPVSLAFRTAVLDPKQMVLNASSLDTLPQLLQSDTFKSPGGFPSWVDGGSLEDLTPLPHFISCEGILFCVETRARGVLSQVVPSWVAVAGCSLPSSC